MQNSIEISVLDSSPMAEALWDQYVDSHPSATFFHLSGYRRLIQKVFNHKPYYLLAKKQDKVCGVLPLVHVKSAIFSNSLVSGAFGVYGGALTDSNEIETKLLEFSENLGRQLGVDFVEVRNTVSSSVDWPKQDLYVRFRREISPNDEENLLQIPRKQRAMVRKACGRNLSAREGQLDDFFKLYCDNMHRHGSPALPKRWFSELIKEFGSRINIWTVHDPSGMPISSVLSFFWRDEILPYYAGDLPAAREFAANDYKYWTLMCFSANKGIKYFDYGRSKIDSGSYSFKKNWGFSPEPLNYQYRLIKVKSIPQNNPNNPKYKNKIKLWRQSPQFVVDIVGPFIAARLP